MNLVFHLQLVLNPEKCPKEKEDEEIPSEHKQIVLKIHTFATCEAQLPFVKKDEVPMIVQEVHALLEKRNHICLQYTAGVLHWCCKDACPGVIE